MEEVKMKEDQEVIFLDVCMVLDQLGIRREILEKLFLTPTSGHRNRLAGQNAAGGDVTSMSALHE